MKFLYETCSHKPISPTPSRLQRLNRAMQRLNVKEIPYHMMWIKAKKGVWYTMPSPVYTAPMQVNSDGNIHGFIDKPCEQVTFADECKGLLDRLNDELITRKEALECYAQLLDFFNK